MPVAPFFLFIAYRNCTQWFLLALRPAHKQILCTFFVPDFLLFFFLVLSEKGVRQREEVLNFCFLAALNDENLQKTSCSCQTERLEPVVEGCWGVCAELSHTACRHEVPARLTAVPFLLRARLVVPLRAER